MESPEPEPDAELVSTAEDEPVRVLRRTKDGTTVEYHPPRADPVLAANAAILTQ